MKKIHKYTNEQSQFIVNNAKGLGNEELKNIFNIQFNLELTKEQIKGFKSNHHVSSGLDGRFKKGDISIPWNKGTKGLTKSNKTSFKEGNIINCKPIGTERIDNKDGYLYIKTEQPNKWQLKHRVIWEKAYGKIPKGDKLVFKDGNRQNIDLDNLILLTPSEELIMNRNKFFSNTKEITETGVLIAKVMDKTNKLKRYNK